jgi:tetratricopeptide (TPR) repeat protein
VVVTNMQLQPYATRSRFITALLFAFLLASSGAAQAQGGKPGKDDEARVLFQAAQMAFTDGRYEDALQYFERSYELSGRAALLFNIGTTADRLRKEERALEAFRQYLVDLPDAENRREVESRVRIIERSLAEEQARADAAAAAAAAAEDDSQASSGGVEYQTDGATDAPKKKSIVKKWWFWTIVGVVAVGAGVGAAAAASGGGGGSGYQGTIDLDPVPGDDGSVIFTLGFGK